MHITKENIISNTKIFVCIMIFISIFKVIFGEENSIVGVTVITSALVLLQRDLTKSVFENFAGLLVINLLSGIFANIAGGNVWIGIPLNLIALFFIGYLFSSNLRAPIVVPFGLQYLFMLFDPVQGHVYLMRLGALAFGAFFIIILQVVFFKTKVKKAFKPLILGTMYDLEEIIESEKTKVENVYNKLDNLKKMFFDRRKKGYYLSHEAKKIINIIWIIEKLAMDIDKNRKLINSNEEFKKYLLEVISEIKESLDKEILEIEVVIYGNSLDSGELEEINVLAAKLKGEMQELWLLKDRETYNYNNEIPRYFNKISVFKRELKLSSLKCSYGARLAIIGTLAIFIATYFKLPQGKWMAYTIFSLIQPYAESSKIRARERIEGTTIGVIIAVVLFLLIKNEMARSLIVLGAGYLNPFAKEYKSIIIIVTVSVIASLAVTGGSIEFGILRIFFVLCGTVLALLGSKYIIPYRIEDGNKEIIYNYGELKRILNKEIKNNKALDSIQGLYLMPVLFEEKIKSVNEGKRLEELMEFVNKEREEMSNLYNKYSKMISNDEKILVNS